MSTLAELRAKLNGEIGVVDDTEMVPWSQAVRNNAITDGYAALWRQGAWKPTTVDVATADGGRIYSVSDIRRLLRAELLDPDGYLVEKLRAIIEPDGAGSWELIVPEQAAGYTIRLYGWTAYKSQFSDDDDEDDLDAEHNRVPLLKAKAILLRAQLATFARYGERQALPPEMNVSIDQFLGLIAAAEREFEVECRALAGLRMRGGGPLTVP